MKKLLVLFNIFIFVVLANICAFAMPIEQELYTEKLDGILQGKSEKNVSITSDGRYRVYAAVRSYDAAGIDAVVYKNNVVIWEQYVPAYEAGIIDVKMQARAGDDIKIVTTPSFSVATNALNESTPVEDFSDITIENFVTGVSVSDGQGMVTVPTKGGASLSIKPDFGMTLTDKTGVLTYKFAYKHELNDNIGLYIGANTVSGLRLGDLNRNDFYPTNESRIWNNSADGWNLVTVKIDLAEKRAYVQIGSLSAWSTDISEQLNNGLNPFRLFLYKWNNTSEQQKFLVDNISASYSEESEYKVTRYDGVMNYSDKTSSCGHSYTTETIYNLTALIDEGKADLYNILYGKRYDMTYYNDELKAWTVPDADEKEARISSKFAHLPSTDVGNPCIDVTVPTEGLIKITGRPYIGIKQDVVVDGEIEYTADTTYLFKIYKNGELLWSNRVGKERLQRYDEPYDTDYFVNNIDATAYVREGDRLTFSFDLWLGTRNIDIPLKDIKIKYISGEYMSESVRKRLDDSIIFDLYDKTVIADEQIFDADIIETDSRIYLAEKDAKLFFASMSDFIIENDKAYYDIESLAIENNMTLTEAESGFLIATQGIAGLVSYAEISELNTRAEVVLGKLTDLNGNIITTEFFDGFAVVNAKLSERVDYTKPVQVFLAGYFGGKLENIDLETLEISNGTDIIRESMSIAKKDYDRIAAYIWQDMTPVSSVLCVEKIKY